MRLLLIDDDEHLCELLSYSLQKAGFTVDSCYDGRDGLHFIRQNAHDLVLLDRMLPGMDGLSVLKAMRAEGFHQPVILLTALGEISDKVTGLNEGADDYIVKPFAFEELLARIHSIARRPQQWQAPKPLTLHDLVFRADQNLLVCGKCSCTLSPREAALLEMLLKNPGQILPRGTLLSRVWGPDAPVEDGNLDNYIHFLRRRLKSVGSQSQIKTVRGTGYRMEVPDVH